MRSFFNAESGIWQIFGWIGDVVVLSLLWTVCSAPLITVGAASAALYDAAAACFVRQEPDYLRRFFRTLRREFTASLLPTLLWGAVLAALFRLVQLVSGSINGAAGQTVTVALLVLLLIPLGICRWVFPILSRFTLDFKTLQQNAVRLALGYMPRTLLMAALSALAAWLTLRLAFLPLFVLPAIVARVDTALLEPVFRRFEQTEE